MRRFAWWCEYASVSDIDADAIQRFLGYLRRGHESEKSGGARWGETSARNKPAISRPVSTSTVRNYFRTLRTFLAWCANEGEMAYYGHVSPMARMNAPIHRDNQTQPFTKDQITRLLEAAKKAGSRDYCICNLLFETGLRVSELASLTLADVDLTGSQIIVRRGKGGKLRTVGFSPEMRRILAAWIREYRPGYSLTGKGRTDGTPPNLVPLFPALRGEETGKRLTASGVNQMVTRWGKVANITGVRCSPHTFRHTFAVNFLRLGGDTFSLQQALGHTSLTMTSKYVYLTEGDVSRQMARFSLVAALRRGEL
jgi:integrase/recombinase XerD